MSPIKVEKRNAEAIQQTLAGVNGKATSHTYNVYEQIEALTAWGERRLEDLDIPKANRTGAVATSVSGDRVANAYKFRRQGTFVRLQRRSGAWYLVACEPQLLYAQGGKTTLHLTVAQDIVAIAKLRTSYLLMAA